MNACTLLITESLLSFALSATVLIVLSRPLRDTLAKACPDTEAAALWLSITRIVLVIVPFLLVLLVDTFSRHSNPLDSLRFALLAALAGVLVGLHSIGKQLSRFVVAPQHKGSAQ